MIVSPNASSTNWLRKSCVDLALSTVIYNSIYKASKKETGEIFTYTNHSKLKGKYKFVRGDKNVLDFFV